MHVFLEPHESTLTKRHLYRFSPLLHSSPVCLTNTDIQTDKRQTDTYHIISYHIDFLSYGATPPVLSGASDTDTQTTLRVIYV